MQHRHNNQPNTILIYHQLNLHYFTPIAYTIIFILFFIRFWKSSLIVVLTICLQVDCGVFYEYYQELIDWCISFLIDLIYQRSPLCTTIVTWIDCEIVRFKKEEIENNAHLVEGEEMANFVEDQNERDGWKEEKHLFHRWSYVIVSRIDWHVVWPSQ